MVFGPVVKIGMQVAMRFGGAIFRGTAAAWKEAAAKSKASGGSGVPMVRHMNVEEARVILHVEEASVADAEALTTARDRLVKLNSPDPENAVHGSPYLVLKVENAYQVLINRIKRADEEKAQKAAQQSAPAGESKETG
jgi:hypothetical protein